MLLNFSIMLFLVGLVVVLKARADVWAGDWAGDDVKVSGLPAASLYLWLITGRSLLCLGLLVGFRWLVMLLLWGFYIIR
jgi:hypothetical protein